MNKTTTIILAILILAGALFYFLIMTNRPNNRQNVPVPPAQEVPNGNSGNNNGNTSVPTNGEQGNGGAAVFSKVLLPFLRTEYEGQPTHGCDRVVFVERTITPTQAPLSAALRELFAIEESNVNGHYNFIAQTNDTLMFNRVTVQNGTAHVYLTGRLSGLAGVCDNPRAAIQIEETAKQFSSVQNVKIYLNEEETVLTPSER